MFRPIALYIGLRYTRAKRRNHFISFISMTSMIGIALGVMVLITVLSVMNGFDQQIRQHFFAMAQQVTVRGMDGQLANWDTMSKKITQANPHVTGTAPYVVGQGLLTNGQQNQAILVYGIDPQREQQVSELPQKMVQGSIHDLHPNRFGIILGAKLAEDLNVGVGGKVNLLIPSASFTPVGVFPRFKVFTVTGIFKVGNGFGYDDQFAYIDMHDAQTLFMLGTHVSGLQLKLSNMYLAPQITQDLAQQLPSGYVVNDWTQTYGAFFQAVKLEKTMMFLMLILIIAVAAFNLVSSLVMVVTDKESDIAILRTLGATPRTILSIFIVQGAIVGIVGTLLGLITGVILASHVTELVNWIQAIFHVQLISSNVYYVNYLPSKLEASDIWHVCLLSLFLSLIATLYPAWRASRTQPAEALRYE